MFGLFGFCFGFFFVVCFVFFFKGKGHNPGYRKAKQLKWIIQQKATYSSKIVTYIPLTMMMFYGGDRVNNLTSFM